MTDNNKDFAGFNHTLAMIKSRAIVDGHESAIIKRITNAFYINSCERVIFTEASAGEFYREHQGRPYYPGLIRSVTGPYGVTFLMLTAENAITAWRDLIGATDPTKAKPGTIRHEFGLPMPDNAVHGSDSPESFYRELAIWRGLTRFTDFINEGLARPGAGR